MRVIKPAMKERLDLVALHRQLGGKLYPGRPHMLIVRMKNARSMQIFSGGCIQILGCVKHKVAQAMRHELLARLSSNSDIACQQLRHIVERGRLSIANLVIHVQLKNELSLKNIVQSDSSLFYEIEIFPAALIRKWSPAHVAMFHNGNIIITGVKSFKKLGELLTCLKDYLPKI